MSMTLHIFRTDIRRTRVLLSVWLILLALQCTLIGWGARLDDKLLQDAYYSMSIVVPLLQIFTIVVLVPFVVQEQPLVGTTAFWFSRPISRLTLLKAKALFALVLIVLPVLAEAAVLAANGVTLHDVGLAAAESVLGDMALILGIAIIAALTANFGRFAIAGAIVLVASFLVQMAITGLRLLSHSESVIGMVSDLGLIKSRGVAANLLIVVGGATILANQYLTRKTARSLVQAGIVAVGMTVINVFWPWNFLAPAERHVAPAKLDTTGTTISLERTSAFDLPSFRGDGNVKKSVSAQLSASGLPAGVFIVAKQVHPRLSLSDGTPLTIVESGPLNQFLYGQGNPGLDAMEYALGGTPIVNSAPDSIRVSSLFTIDGDLFRKFTGTPLKFAADIDFAAQRYIASELPLVRGSRYDNGSLHEMITDVLLETGGVEVIIEQRRIQLLFDRSEAPANPAPFLRQGDAVYVLLNKRRNQAVLPMQQIRFNPLPQVGKLVKRTIRLPFGPEPNLLTPIMDKEWVAGAVLVRLQRAPLADFSKPLVVDNFKFEGTNRSGAEAQPVGHSITDMKLAERPTKAQVRDYIEAIMVASQRRSAYRIDDPQVEMLCKVGKENVDELMAADDRMGRARGSVYLDEAIEKLARPEDKALVLKALASHPRLVTLVVKYQWKAEAHATLLAGLKDPHERSLPKEWIEAVASFEEPGTYPDLKAYLVRCFNRQQTFEAIKALPGIDLRDTVAESWKNAQRGTPGEQLAGCAMAAEYGHIDALDALVRILKESENDVQLRRAAVLLRRYTNATGDSDELVAWYQANRDNLRFDEQQRKFLPKPAK